MAPKVNLQGASGISIEITDTIKDMLTYHIWNPEQISQGTEVKEAFAQALRTIIQCVPPSADRSCAIRKLREARMDCNSAITHEGKY